ncbi:transcriptional regulator, TetR family [Agromyces sp. CF514]|uniref:TetR/AcrR family transcriptional regulator n=1 Tax=Agromyces sp. CF514 TaxID=1881031 RepID=UPI0008EE57D8|nr:TetR/AcrR family transcriptional regulator [Agromyces sp. CF514]SFR67557.1 transcriptional regulator, TetR family [Agromyces sp. CF514]
MTRVSDAPSPAASRASPKGERRRAEIIAAAFAAFAAGGYRGASMVQIAAACGVSRAGLLHHFPAKELLLAAVLEERDRVNGELFFVDVDPRRDGVEHFEHLIRLVAHNAGQRELVQLFATLSAEAADPAHPAHAYFVDRYRLLEADFDLALREIAERGLLRPGVVLDGAARDLIALIDGLQVQWLLDPAGIDIVARLRRRLREVVDAEFAP